MKLIFRPRRRAWLDTALAVPLALVLAGALLAVAPGRWGLAAVLVAISVLVALADARSLWRTHVTVDETSFSGCVKGHTFGVCWADVLAVGRFTDLENRKYLNLAIEEGILRISLEKLDAEAVWQSVVEHLPAAAVGETAFECLPYYEEGRAERERLLHDVASPLVVRVTGLWKAVGLVAVLLFLLIAVLTLSSSQAPVAVCFFPFVLLGGLVLFMSYQRLELDSEGITLVNWLGRSRMAWDEVVSIERNKDDGALILVGGDKRLACPGLSTWSAKERMAAIDLFAIQVDDRQIPIRTSLWALFKWSKGTRLRAQGKGGQR